MRYKITMNIGAQIILLPFLFIVSTLLIIEVVDFQDTREEGNKEVIKATIQKYAIQCYASEGNYPKDISYLEEEYGLILDHDRYFYDYDIFASNLMPDITVFGEDDYVGE